MKNLLFLLGSLFLGSALSAQEIQWAAKVLEKSSEYTRKTYSAQQILGVPDVYPEFRDSPCAWSPLKEENRQAEFIHVAYKKPMQIQQVAIVESQNPGAVSKVLLVATTGKTYKLYENKTTTALSEKGRIFRIKIPRTDYKVKSVKVFLDTRGLPGWNHIDAIGIMDSQADLVPGINLVQDLHFPGKATSLGFNINSEYDEIMPVISPDGKTLYFDRKDHPDNTDGTLNDDIWVSHLGQDGRWTRAENVGAPMNNQGHNFLCAISLDGNTALLGNTYLPDGVMKSGLSMSTRQEGEWQFPWKLDIENYYNNNKFSEFCLSVDGKIIVMTIQRSNSEGGKDLYVSFQDEAGNWSEPKHMGPTVNTAATEMSPFLAADGKTLYFSSDGFSGYGGKDMFISRRLDNSWTRWSTPQNLGPVINSKDWDAYYTVPASGEYAYYSSEKNAIGKTDIFRIPLPEALRPGAVVLLKGTVMDQQALKPVEATLTFKPHAGSDEIYSVKTDPVTGNYSIILPAGVAYAMLVTCPDFQSFSEDLDFSGLRKYKEMSKDVGLQAGR